MDNHFNKMTQLASLFMLAALTAFILGFLLSAVKSQAENLPVVPVQFYYIRGKESMPYREALRAIKRVQAVYKKHLQLDLRVRKIKVQRDIFKQENYLAHTSARFLNWYDWSDGKRKKGEITQLLLSPQFDGRGSKGNWYTTGLAWLGCYRTSTLFNFSTAFITLRSADKHSRFVEGVIAIAHELGHNIGADHIRDCSLMDTYALHCYAESGVFPRINEKTKKAMLGCALDKA